MSKAFCREEGSYLVEPEPPKENPCQVPWGCVHKDQCRNADCFYGRNNLIAEKQRG
jgi:hypothetical protein